MESRQRWYDPIAKTGAWLDKVFTGHLNYFAVLTNARSEKWHSASKARAIVASRPQAHSMPAVSAPLQERRPWIVNFEEPFPPDHNTNMPLDARFRKEEEFCRCGGRLMLPTCRANDTFSMLTHCRIRLITDIPWS